MIGGNEIEIDEPTSVVATPEASVEVEPNVRILRDAASAPAALRFPARWLEEHALLPLTIDDNLAVVAADGFPDTLVLAALRRHFAVPVQFTQYRAGDIRAALLSAPRDVDHTSARGGDHGLIGETAESVDDLRALASREPVVQVVNAILAEAVRTGASDVHVESTANGLRVRARLDGVLHNVQLLNRGFQAAVLSRLKVLAGLDIAERRVPQDGRARIRVLEREIDVRVSTLPALHGESIVLRLLDGGGAQSTRRLDDLGIGAEVKKQFSHMLARTSGLVLVTGPTGSGKTTTLYAALAERSTEGVKVVTVEDPVEYRFDGVVQLPVNTKAGFSFPNALRAILRHDPDVILVGEMRDTETAEIAVQAALTGHLVLSTLHTTDATGALARLTEMGVPRYLLAAPLHGVLAQRLVRTVCNDCGSWRDVDSGEIALVTAYVCGDVGDDRFVTEHDTRAGMQKSAAVEPSITRVREGAGCPLCAHTGFRGRAAITELVVLDERLRAAFVRGDSLDEMRAAVRASGATGLRHDGFRLVREGRTTIAEVTRVVSEDEVA